MLALLKPWRTASDLKDNESRSEMLDRFIVQSPTIIRRIVAGVQYFYDSKAASDSSADANRGEVASHRCPNELIDDDRQGDMEGASGEATSLVLTEQDLENLKSKVNSSREAKHAKDAIDITLLQVIFRAAGPFKLSSSRSYQFATGEDKVRLISWEVAMKSMVAVSNVAAGGDGQLTPFNAYITLSRIPGRDNIRLLHSFDERPFTKHPNEHLRHEDLWLAQ